MIFKQWQQVLDGTKTQTRRPVNIGNLGDFAITDTLYTANTTDRHVVVYGIKGRAKWETGKTYAVQPGRGKKAVGRIRITKIGRERLKDISDKDCLAEGIGIHPEHPAWYTVPMSHDLGARPRQAFAYLWGYIHGKGAWDRMKNDDVWVLDFELAEGFK